MANPKQILVIDDDQELNDLLKGYLSQYELGVTTAIRPGEGLKLVKRMNPDLVILDVTMPDKDGFEVLREIRKNSTVPVIMLTARGNVTDRVVGLEIGADDYMPKPFEPRELVARIQSVLRRHKLRLSPEGILQSGQLAVDLENRAVHFKGKVLDLTFNEFEMLVIFMKNSGMLLNRNRIMELFKGTESEAFDRTIDITVSRLRKKLRETASNPHFIKTIWGEGYLFTGKVIFSEKQ